MKCIHLSIVLALGVIPLALLAQAPAPQETGSFSGTVILDKTQPLAGASVVFVKQTKLIRDRQGRVIPVEAAFSGNVLSGADGSFRASGLPYGRYVVCASGPAADHLRSCDWGRGSSIVDVKAGEPTPNLTVDIRTGSLLSINITDPSGQIRTRDLTGINARETTVAIGVVSSQGYYGARFAGRSGNVWSYSVAIPVKTTVSLLLDSAHKIVDQSARTVLNRTPSVTARSEDSAGVSLNLSVE